MCPVTGKKCMTKEEADYALILSKQNGHKKIHSNNRDRVPKRKYFCHECDSWHLTSESNRKYRDYENYKRKKRQAGKNNRSR